MASSPLQPILRNLSEAEALELERHQNWLEGLRSKSFPWLSLLLFAGLIAGAIYLLLTYDDFALQIFAWFLALAGATGIVSGIEGTIDLRKDSAEWLQQLQAVKNEAQLQAIEVQATRIAQYPSWKDEGDLYLIETASGSCFYLRDRDFQLQQLANFPNDHFDIYTQKDVQVAFRKRINCYGTALQPVVGDPHHKWEYFARTERGFPEDLEVAERSFDSIVKAIADVQL